MKKRLTTLLIAVTFSISTIAYGNQCPRDPLYKDSNGHRAKGARLSQSERKNVTVCSVNLPPVWRVSLKKAVNAINNDLRGSKANIKFSYVRSKTCMIPAKMKSFSSGENPEKAPAYSRSPPSSRFRAIYVNKNPPKQLKGSHQIQSIFMHEILHTVGFDHTGIATGQIITGTVDKKLNTRSILCRIAPSSKNPPLHLNRMDIKAIEKYYQ